MTLKNALVSAAGNAAADRLYVEDVFSTYLYTGDGTAGSSRTITNGIDLDAEGGLVWIKSRSAASGHRLTSTNFTSVNPASFAIQCLTSNGQNALLNYQDGITTWNSDGFTMQDRSGSGWVGGFNNNGHTYASWTFRKAEKFFDVVTYTGTGAAQTISHNLGSVPGCMIVKRTDFSSNWYVYHRSLDPGGNPATAFLALNLTDAVNSTLAWTNTQPTSTVFYVGDGVGQNPINQNGATYVAYLFAHDAGGFGADGMENVISCGSYTGNGSSNGPEIDLGWEPQFVMIKSSTLSSSNWVMVDNMRGMSETSDRWLYANLSNAEAVAGTYITSKANGFKINGTGSYVNSSGQTYIYIAIRRGPMKVPESGTEVFAVQAPNTGTSFPYIISGFPVDFGLVRSNRTATSSIQTSSRLQGDNYFQTATTDAEASAGGGFAFDSNVGWANVSGANLVSWMFRRAPGFFDVVCYTGNGVAGRTVQHNLTVVPEMIIVKRRDAAGDWPVYQAYAGTTTGINQQLILNSTSKLASGASEYYFGNNTSLIAPTLSDFTVGTANAINNGATPGTYIAYLFATLAGVSKVGSYTGTGTTNQIDCGFSSGARYVLIKRTDSTGDWYVWDSARGIVAGNDPYLLLNSTAAEVTSTDYVDTYSAGFEISSTAPAEINANGGSFIFLAIA